MGNFAETITRLHFQSMRFRQETGGFHGAPQARRINGGHLFRAESHAQPARLIAAFIGELHVGGSGETILSGESGRAVANKKNAGVHAAYAARSL